MEKLMISEDRYGRNNNHFENDDFVDRLNSRYTVYLLMLSIFIVMAKLYVGNSINCWTPAQFTGTHNDYTNSICWLKGSYYLPTEEITIPDRSKPRVYYVSYYQWTPFILLAMGLLFLSPRLLWHALTKQCGLDIQRLVKTIKDQPAEDKGVKYARRTLHDFIQTRRRMQGLICCGFRVRNLYSGLMIMYFIIKSLYVINVIAQFLLLNMFLAFQFTSYGFEAWSKVFSGWDWFESPRFPRVTMCDFMIRHLGSNQHWYAIQCNLPINIYNEKIFFAIWIWLIILMVLNILSMIFWIFSLGRSRQMATVKKYLKIGPIVSTSEEKAPQSPSAEMTTTISTRAFAPLLRSSPENLADFTNYLTTDGFLAFRIISHNTDDIVAGKILNYLYKEFEKESPRNPESDV